MAALLVLCVAVPDRSEAQVVDENLQISVSASDVVHVEPTIAASPRDPSRLVVASMIVRRPRSPDFQDSSSLAVYASRDGGVTWQQRPLPGLPSDRVSGDPWLTWTADDVVYLSAIVTPSLLEGKPISTWVFRSTDGGWTWSGPERDVFGPGREVDHPITAAAEEAGGSSSVYVFGTMTTSDEAGVRLARREAGGPGFRPLDPFTVDRPQVNLGGGVALPGGEVMVTYFNMGRPPYGLWVGRRTRAGRWSETRLRESILPVGFPGLALDAASDGFAGRAYAVWVEGADERDQSDLRVLLSSSDDGGGSWSPPVRVHRHTVPTRRTLPSVAVRGDGVVAVSWADARHASDRADCVDLYAAVSTDGGASFTPEFRVSDETSCFGTPANGAAARRWRMGGGDYLGLAADADGLFHAVWADSRTGRFQLWTSTFRMPAKDPNGGPPRSQ
jgi:hypothetical protein